MDQAGDEPPTILVVDDDAVQQMHASDLLTEAGYRVIEAPDADTALSILHRQPDVCLVFTDVQMPPGRDGVELARQVHQHWPNVRLLITSGGAQVDPATLPGGSAFIPKPYNDEEVLGHVEDMVGGRVGSGSEPA